jgi:hypothetical protein
MVHVTAVTLYTRFLLIIKHIACGIVKGNAPSIDLKFKSINNDAENHKLLSPRS